MKLSSRISGAEGKGIVDKGAVGKQLKLQQTTGVKLVYTVASGTVRYLIKISPYPKIRQFHKHMICVDCMEIVLIGLIYLPKRV